MTQSKNPVSGTNQQESLEQRQPEQLYLHRDFPIPALDQWREAVTKDLKGADFEKKLVWQTPEGFPVQPLYTAEDLAELPHVDVLPGFAPFVRGTTPLAGVSPSWQVRQDCVLPTAEEVNAAIRDGIARGQTAIGIRMDNGVRRGLDGDTPGVEELAGRGGCTISSINGLRIALQDIDLTRYPITIRSGAAALPTLAMLVALADERGFDRKLLTGAFECDPIRVLVKTGKLRGTLELQYREMAEIVSFCARECPGIRGVMVNSHPVHNAGASAVQEVAITLAQGTEYMRSLIYHGLSADTAALGMLFSFSVSTNLFMEIAKLRAARMLWAKIVKAFGAKKEEAWRMFLHVRTSPNTKTVNDPYNNIVRSSVEAFAAAVGGCDSMYVAPFDEPIGTADEFSMRVARNQQLLLQEEAYLSKVVDAAGGSYYVESLTDSIAREAWKLFQDIEAQGGLVKALKAGTPQKAIREVSEKKKAMISKRRQSIVGVSSYPNPKEKPVVKQEENRQQFLAKRRERLARLKSVRKNSEVRSLLAAITNTLKGTAGFNLMEVAISAAREGATIGEILGAMTAAADGKPITVEPVLSERYSEPYERLRARAAVYTEKNGAMPKVFLVPAGPLGMRRARADFSHGFFGAGGFEVEEPAAFKDMKDAAKAAAESGALIAVLCSDDASYTELVPAFVEKAKGAKPELLVYVAGYPQESLEALKEAGVDGFIHIKSDVLETLKGLHDKLKIGL